MKHILELILILLLLLIGALTAASETSVIAASIVKLKRLSSEGSKTARVILKILETPERFFGTILVANNIVGSFIASILTAIIISFIGDRGRGVLLATFVAAFLIIVFEVTAKTIAAKNPLRISLSLANSIKALIFIFSPIVKVLSLITNLVLKIIGAKTKGLPSLVVEEEIKALIKIGEEEGSYHREKYRMLAKVFEFSGTIVRQVMTPRDKMVVIDIKANIDEILEQAMESGYSRLPVYDGQPDNIVGIINMKDLLNLSVNRDLIILNDIIYPAIFVPSSKNVTELLKEFQKGHTHLAIAVDKDGKIEGLVTLEDLLEEIVGEIEDEYDVRTKPPRHA
jgi:putative hemolysin